ncbi:SRPBCC family protein [Robiginitalea sp. SC105]|uniref:SRPBCC family protein n=1 Tax=Robiginitalea sp. SC105 TaxID=2762332 RepID=UPI00163B2C81|nr:SRPBCC family protein [Robiginitalea sp. SC105]MBC2840384.1 SRPBCC family protein [Robiginitalea sp. SC105]
MKSYQLQAEQFLALPVGEAWDFLSNPANLERITPQHMGFRILAGADRSMFPGQIIHYSVSPFRGFRTRWVTEITHVAQGQYFVDEQRFGPYAFWHHKHFIEPADGGVRMVDVIDYKLPLGWLGHLAHGLLVKKQLSNIFRYRVAELERRFGQLPGKPAVLSFKTL